MRARWRRTTVRALGGQDATTHATLRSRGPRLYRSIASSYWVTGMLPRHPVRYKAVPKPTWQRRNIGGKFTASRSANAHSNTCMAWTAPPGAGRSGRHPCAGKVGVIDGLDQPERASSAYVRPSANAPSSARHRATCARATTDCTFVVPKRSRSGTRAGSRRFACRLRRLPVVVQDPQVGSPRKLLAVTCRPMSPRAVPMASALGGHESFVRMALMPQTYR